MIRNLKAVLLALVAIAAIGAMSAASASADFESEAEEVQLTVSSNATQKFKVKAGALLTVECNTVSVESTATGTPNGKIFTATEITATPTYGSCATILGEEVTVDTNGCQYVFHLADNSTTGTVDIECGEKPIQITVGSLCTYDIGTQTGLGTIHYSNKGEGSTREVVMEPTVTNITSTRTGSFLCSAGSNLGTYEGELTVTGELPGTNTHTGIWVD